MNFDQLWQEYKELILVVATAVATLIATLLGQKILPGLWKAVTKLWEKITVGLDRRLSTEKFERRYLDWLCEEHRFLKVRLDAMEIRRFSQRGLAEVDQVAVRGQVSFLDHGRCRHLEIHITQEGCIVVVLGCVLRIGQGGRQANDAYIGKRLDQFSQDKGPIVEQVMAFVQDEGAGARGGDAIYETAGIRVKELATIKAALS